MNLVESVRLYIRRITKDVPGMKALLLDKETTAIISSIYTVSELLAEEIYLVDLIENKREKIGKLKAIVFVRPDVASIEFIKSELRDPPFEEYYIYFSNAVQPAVIDSLAAADMHEVVHELKEYFCDYIAINADLFNLNISDPILVSPTTWTASCLDRTVQGITGVLLSLKKKPVIQYEVNSSVAENLAIEIGHSIENEGQLYDFKKSDTAPLLLLLDRRNDPVTPLLTQWTYQAMVHEMIGIENGRVDMSATTGSDSTPQAKELVLSQEQDPFYRANMFLNFGDLGVNIRAYVNEFGQKHNSNKQVETLADMKSFVEQYPEFQKLSGNVSKHVALISELGKQVEARKLLEYGELEQSLGTTNMSTDAIILEKLLEDKLISLEYKEKMVILYALRYEKAAPQKIKGFIDALKNQGGSEQTVESMLAFAGSNFRLEPMSSVDKLFESTKTIFKGLKGVENVYTQHVPRLVSIITSAVEGKLKPELFRYSIGPTAKEKPQDIIVFVVGGTTYGEAMHINKLSQQWPGVRIILGGTSIHNSKSFVEQVNKTIKNYKNALRDPKIPINLNTVDKSARLA